MEQQLNPFKRTREDHQTETAEDYVELIDELIATRGEARVVDLAERLGVSAVTVAQTVQRLAKAGFVETEPYRSIYLTEKGAALAEEMRHRHDTVEKFLLALGVPEDVARIDTEGIEHHVSVETLRAMRRYLESRE